MSVRYSFDLASKKMKISNIYYRWLSQNPNAYKRNVMYRKHLLNGYFSFYRDRLTYL
jgi:hypothetical protein